MDLHALARSPRGARPARSSAERVRRGWRRRLTAPWRARRDAARLAVAFCDACARVSVRDFEQRLADARRAACEQALRAGVPC